ncbi:hypothetical protein D3C87_959350 [compost metagenome]
MYFPQWVESSKTDSARATARLTYIIYFLALQHCRRPSIRAFARFLKLTNTVTILVHIKNGSFSRTMAHTIITGTRTTLITEDHLVYPLEIKISKTPTA